MSLDMRMTATAVGPDNTNTASITARKLERGQDTHRYANGQGSIVSQVT